jgi:hypothetical protein
MTGWPVLRANEIHKCNMDATPRCSTLPHKSRTCLFMTISRVRMFRIHFLWTKWAKIEFWSQNNYLFNRNPVFFSKSKVKFYLIMNTTNEMQLYRLIYYSQSALHVSGDVFVHHQEHLTVFTASGNVYQCRCRQVSWMSWNSSSNSSKTPAGSRLCEYYQIL